MLSIVIFVSNYLLFLTNLIWNVKLHLSNQWHAQNSDLRWSRRRYSNKLTTRLRFVTPFFIVLNYDPKMNVYKFPKFLCIWLEFLHVAVVRINKTIGTYFDNFWAIYRTLKFWNSLIFLELWFHKVFNFQFRVSKLKS